MKTDDHSPEAGSVDPSSKELLHLLTNPRRRYLLHRLSQTTHPFELKTLEKEIAAWEAGATPETASAEHIDRVRKALAHTHIPKLTSAGFLKFDEQSDMVSLNRASARLTPVLEAIEDVDLDDVQE